jgi:chitodextrinase
MTKSNTDVAVFSAKTAAAAWINARNAAAKKVIRDKVAATAKTNKRKRWSRLLKDIDANDKVRVKARASGDWKPVNDARPVTPAKPKATKPKAKAPVAAEGVTPVDAAKALAALVGADLGGSPEALALVAFINRS